jgi:hypothetical protein
MPFVLIIWKLCSFMAIPLDRFSLNATEPRARCVPF